MSDIAITTTTLANDRDYRWAASSHGLNATQGASVLVSATTEATHWPNGHLKRGLLLAKFTSGGNAGLWAPYVDNDTAGEGLGTVAGIVIDGFKIDKDGAGSPVSTNVFGSVVLAGVPIQIFVDKLPGLLLEDGTTAYAPTATEIASDTAWVAVSL